MGAGRDCLFNAAKGVTAQQSKNGTPGPAQDETTETAA